jgi:histidyl-tRNA synthetase
MEIKTEVVTKGTRILFGHSAYIKHGIIQLLEAKAMCKGYLRMTIPILQFQSTFASKVGGENQKMMYAFKDAGDRDLCLAPEYTAVIQTLAKDYLKYQKDVLIFYTQECFRAEKPQAGRYRQFTQFGVEILNPTKDYKEELIAMAKEMIIGSLPEDTDESKVIVNANTSRGLDYYKEGQGFEISFTDLGAQQQICGGGAYEDGIGFAIGVDRLLLANTLKQEQCKQTKKSKS